jgi:hypothetical protein
LHVCNQCCPQAILNKYPPPPIRISMATRSTRSRPSAKAAWLNKHHGLVFESLPSANTLFFCGTPDSPVLYLGSRKFSSGIGSEPGIYTHEYACLTVGTDGTLSVSIREKEIRLESGNGCVWPRSASSLLREGCDLVEPFRFLHFDYDLAVSRVRDILFAVVLYYFAAADLSDAAYSWSKFEESFDRAMTYIGTSAEYQKWIDHTVHEDKEDSQITLSPEIAGENFSECSSLSSLDLEEQSDNRDILTIPLNAILVRLSGTTIPVTGKNIALRKRSAHGNLLAELRSKDDLKVLENMTRITIYMCLSSFEGYFEHRMLIGTFLNPTSAGTINFGFLKKPMWVSLHMWIHC